MDRRSSISVFVAALLVAACGSSSPSGQASSSATQGIASPSASLPAESAPPIIAGPAWDAIQDAIDAEGHVSKDTALQAFALAFGGLPGVTPPPGDPGTVHSGTLAVRWVMSYWDELTPEQQAAAVDLIPELGGLPRSASAPGAVMLAAARPNPPTSVDAPYAYRRSNAAYTQLAKELFTEIGSRLKSSLTIALPIDAHAGLPVKSTSGMETTVLDAKGGISGAAGKCVIVVSPLGDQQTDIDARYEMAHEVFHCFEGAIVGPQRLASDNPAPWIIEGGASWVGATVVPDSPLATQEWWDYLYRTDLPLFSRTYSGIGYFGHLEAAGVDPWDRLVPVLTATSNTDAFAASGAETDQFLGTWAPSLLDDPARGAQWSLSGPAKPPPNRSKPVEIHLSNGGSVETSAAPYANEIAVFAESPDVLQTSFVGRARLSDAAGHDYLADDGDASFCMLSSGCACPGASTDEPPMLALDGADVALGVTGGPKGASGTLTGTKLDDYCRKGITGTWDGSAEVSGYRVVNDFTLKVVQKGATFSGTTDLTGPNCVHQAGVTGTVSGSDISMRWAAAGLQPVELEGTLSGNSMSGTFTAISCPPGNLNIDGTWSATRRKQGGHTGPARSTTTKGAIVGNLVVHFEIHATEPQRLVDFYSELLGWRFSRFGEVEYWTIDTGEGAIGNVAGAAGHGINGGLVPRRGPRPDVGAPVAGCNIVIGVDDVDGLMRSGIELGATEALPAQDMQGVGRLGYLLDPDNNVFGMISPVMSDGTRAMGGGG
jgi:hypothetical protein